MRTKTLLIAGAALVLSLANSQAQVYSANVVGYANVVYTGAGGYTLVANPLDDGAGNQLTNIIGNLPNKSQVITWAGTVYNPAIQKGSGVWPSSVALPPGTGFFVKNGIASSPVFTNTFVGTVIVPVAATVTNSLPAGYSLVGSAVPYTGDATVDTNINLGANLANKSQLISWNVGSQGYDATLQKGSGTWPSSFNISVGQGFFVKSFTATNWIQTLNP